MSSSSPILVVNRTPGNAALLRDFLERRGYRAIAAGSLDEIDSALDRGAAYGLALIDVSGFDQRIWQRCSRLHAEGIPFLIISAHTGNDGSDEGLRHGARGVLRKPLAMKELAHLIDTLVV